MANNYETFATEFKGYKKQQVEDFIAQAAAEKENFSAILQKKNEEIEALKTELAELKEEHEAAEEQLIALDEDLTRAEEDVNALKAENELANGALQETKKRCDELTVRCNKLQADEERVARILVDTEKRSEQMIADTIDKCLLEKERLTKECDSIKEEIYDRLCYLRSIESLTRKSVSNILASVKSRAGEFEAEVLSDIAAQDEKLESFIAEKEKAAGLAPEAENEGENETDELSEVRF